MAIIAISRSTLKGGKELAELLAEKTGYPIFSREEVLAQAAEEYGTSVKNLEETVLKLPSFWEQIPGKRIHFIKCFTSVLLDMAAGKDFIYHGQTGHLLLKGIEHVMRVRVIADMEYRISAAMEQLNIGKDEAIVHIQKIDKERNDWSQFFYGVNWGDPILYDLVLNLEKMGLETACGAIIHLNDQPDFKATAESKKALNDLTLSTEVWATLAKNKSTKSASINVTADAGKVTLSGHVSSTKAADEVIAVARQVDGVEKIVNDVGVGRDWYW